MSNSREGSASTPTSVTDLIRQAGDDVSAAESLLPFVYEELRQLAAHRMACERPGQTLQATALVHEAYVRLTARGGQQQRWDNRGHFFAAAAEAMRRILIESARRKGRVKRGGDGERVELTLAEPEAPQEQPDVLALHEALERLEAEDARKAAVVKLRFFAGLTIAEAADALDISVSTAASDWAFARAWIKVEMTR